MKFCSYCGNSVEPNAKFCPSCGGKLSEQQQQPQQYSQPTHQFGGQTQQFNANALASNEPPELVYGSSSIVLSIMMCVFIAVSIFFYSLGTLLFSFILSIISAANPSDSNDIIMFYIVAVAKIIISVFCGISVFINSFTKTDRIRIRPNKMLWSLVLIIAVISLYLWDYYQKFYTPSGDITFQFFFHHWVDIVTILLAVVLIFIVLAAKSRFKRTGSYIKD